MFIQPVSGETGNAPTSHHYLCSFWSSNCSEYYDFHLNPEIVQKTFTGIIMMMFVANSPSSTCQLHVHSFLPNKSVSQDDETLG
jgi:hypothetical protein